MSTQQELLPLSTASEQERLESRHLAAVFAFRDVRERAPDGTITGFGYRRDLDPRIAWP